MFGKTVIVAYISSTSMSRLGIILYCLLNVYSGYKKLILSKNYEGANKEPVHK